MKNRPDLSTLSESKKDALILSLYDEIDYLHLQISEKKAEIDKFRNKPKKLSKKTQKQPKDKISPNTDTTAPDVIASHNATECEACSTSLAKITATIHRTKQKKCSCGHLNISTFTPEVTSLVQHESHKKTLKECTKGKECTQNSSKITQFSNNATPFLLNIKKFSHEKYHSLIRAASKKIKINKHLNKSLLKKYKVLFKCSLQKSLSALSINIKKPKVKVILKIFTSSTLKTALLTKHSLGYKKYISALPNVVHNFKKKISAIFN